MKVTVCQLTNDMNALEAQWHALCAHVQQQASDVVLLPEMPFYAWLSHTREVDPAKWQAAVDAHSRWLARLPELGAATVIGTRPVIRQGKRLNEGFIWHAKAGYNAVHDKYYLPDEEEFWEASWYERGSGEFRVVDSPAGKLGFLICTEIWFNARAREYAKEGIQLLVCPRATPKGTEDKWLAGARTAAVVAGAYCLSSNLGGLTKAGGNYGGLGWIIGPDVGDVLGVTSDSDPFVTREINLEKSDQAKSGYPRYVLD